MIQSVRELLLTGYKIGFSKYIPIREPTIWFGNNFRGIRHLRNTSFTPMAFDDTMFDKIVENSGALAAYWEENYLSYSLEKCRQSVWKSKAAVKCHIVTEPFYAIEGHVKYGVMFVHHMANSFHRTSTKFFESGIWRLLIKIHI